MSDKKRKSTAGESGPPSKKQQTASHVTVTHLKNASTLTPVIGASSGVRIPTDIKFQSFARKNSDNSSDLLLHSTEHPTINYTAKEGDASGESYLKHYVAIFDPATGKLQVTEAKKMSIRSSLRTREAAQDEDDDEHTAPVTNYTSRAALTQAFGTKKSKKAVQSIAENRLLAQGDEEADHPITSASFGNVPDADPIVEGGLDAAVLVNKPIPQPNLQTNDVSQVYPLRELVKPSPVDKTLAAMPVTTWISTISNKNEILTRYRYVANRVGYLTKKLVASPDASDATLKRHLQVLRYILLLLDIHKYAVTLPRKRSIPPVSKWPDSVFSEETPISLVGGILPRFFTGDKLPTTHAITLLRTTILALTLTVPPPSLQTGQGTLITEPTDIALDMAVEPVEVRKLFRELGCKIEAATENELRLWGLEKLAAAKKKKSKGEDGVGGMGGGGRPMFAKLKLPLTFPKVSRGAPKGRR